MVVSDFFGEPGMRCCSFIPSLLRLEPGKGTPATELLLSASLYTFRASIALLREKPRSRVPADVGDVCASGAVAAAKVFKLCSNGDILLLLFALVEHCHIGSAVLTIRSGAAVPRAILSLGLVDSLVPASTMALPS